jgi:sarcosine oxidase
MDADVVVVGAGIMGAATARALAREGHDVVVLERFEVGHRRGSSHGASRIFRLSYDDPVYVRMAQDALALWRGLEEELSATVLTTTGGVDIGDGALANARALAACGVDHERMRGREAAERFTEFSFPPDIAVLHQPDAGIVHADVAWPGFLRSARAHGAEIRERIRAVGLDAASDRVTVRTDRGSVTARVAVVTAGAWARDLLATAGIDLPVTVTRETAAYYGLETEWPPILVQWEAVPYYALPNPGKGIKAAQHHAGPLTDPEAEGEVGEEAVARLSAWVKERFRGVDPDPQAAETCLYTNTADERFILERRGPVVIGSPCSGHGFKFASLIGERLAGLAVGRA